ncbi:hypothetical protein [Halomonas sp. M20]|uniref:hypothetical protein n=1 Tax=Halomonas sp. M20 TaxID=2763264 RepID=UPI001D0A36BA|nr:hypothetical protein [Halomonas sp. M20]
MTYRILALIIILLFSCSSVYAQTSEVESDLDILGLTLGMSPAEVKKSMAELEFYLKYDERRKLENTDIEFTHREEWAAANDEDRKISFYYTSSPAESRVIGIGFMSGRNSKLKPVDQLTEPLFGRYGMPQYGPISTVEGRFIWARESNPKQPHGEAYERLCLDSLSRVDPKISSTPPEASKHCLGVYLTVTVKTRMGKSGLLAKSYASNLWDYGEVRANLKSFSQYASREARKAEEKMIKKVEVPKQEIYDIVYEGEVQNPLDKEIYPAILARKLEERRLTIHGLGCSYSLKERKSRWIGIRLNGPCPSSVKLFIRHRSGEEVHLRSAGWNENMTVEGVLKFKGRADIPLYLCRSGSMMRHSSECRLWSMEYAPQDLLTSYAEKKVKRDAERREARLAKERAATAAYAAELAVSEKRRAEKRATKMAKLRKTIMPRIPETSECDESKLPDPTWSPDTPLDYSAFTFVCRKPTHMDPPRWYLGLASTDLGHEFRLTDKRTRAGQIIDNVARGGSMYVEISEMLQLLGDLQPDNIAQLTLFDPASKLSKLDNDYYFRAEIRRVRPGAEPPPKLVYLAGNLMGDKMQMFASADWLGLERQLEADAEAALAPLQSLLGNAGMALGAGALYQTRYARLITAYAILRMNIHGSCGEGTEQVVWTTTHWKEYRNGYGHYRGSSAPTSTREAFPVPVGFRAPFKKVDTIKVDRSELNSLEKVVRHLDCANPARRVVEQNMLRFYHHRY